ARTTPPLFFRLVLLRFGVAVIRAVVERDHRDLLELLLKLTEPFDWELRLGPTRLPRARRRDAHLLRGHRNALRHRLRQQLRVDPALRRGVRRHIPRRGLRAGPLRHAAGVAFNFLERVGQHSGRLAARRGLSLDWTLSHSWPPKVCLHFWLQRSVRRGAVFQTASRAFPERPAHTSDKALARGPTSPGQCPVSW